MAYDWEHVEAIRAAQTSARERFNQEVVAGDSMAADIRNSPGARETGIRDLDSWDAKLFKLRTQLIDYIIEHGLVQGFNWDGNDYPIKGGKIVVTEEMVKMVTDRFGYFTEKETLAFVEKYLPEHHYVSDSQYVHTDNNYTTEEKEKLSGVETGAQVNAILDVIFNGNTVLDPETKVATITITPEMVKEWYESNENTNAFTDAEKAKLEGIDTKALANKVEDVTLDGETVVKNKIAALTAKKIKDSYESNPDTNAFTDGDKVLVESTIPELVKGVNQHEKRLDDLEDFQTEQEKKNNAFTAKDSEQDARLDAIEAKNATQDAEIKETKDSISELGGEVNSIAGRVSTNETEIANLKTSQTAQDEDISQLQKDVNNINKKDTAQDTEIEKLKTDVANAGKVDDVQVDGASVVENKVAKIPKVYTEEEIKALVKEGFIPYTAPTETWNASNSEQITDTTDQENPVTYTAFLNNALVQLGNGYNKSSFLTDYGLELGLNGLLFRRMYPDTTVKEEIDGTITNRKLNANDYNSVWVNLSTAGLAFGKRLQGDGIAFGAVIYPLANENSDVDGLALIKPQGGGLRQKVTLYGATVEKADDTNLKGTAYVNTDYLETHKGKNLSTPTEDTDAANKKYVDDKIAAIPSVDTSTLVPYVGATADVYLDGHNLSVRNAEDTTANAEITPDWVAVNDGSGHTGTITAQALSVTDSSGLDATLDISRLTFSKNGVQGGGVIRGLETPTSDKDAANKKYVDDKVSSPENCLHYIDIGIVLPKGTTIAAGDRDTEWWEVTNPHEFNAFYTSLPDGYDYHIVGITSLNTSPGSNLELGLPGIGMADGYEYPTMTVWNRTSASITTASAMTVRFRMAYTLTKHQ